MGNASASKHGAMGWADDEPGREGTVVGKAFVVLTTEQIRELCADDGGLAEYHDPINGHHEADRAREMFDRWLAAHDAEVAAKAWDEGAKRRTDDSFMRQNLSETLAKNPHRRIAAPSTPEGGQDA